ncbi:hypothetical protein J4E85_010503 [Alternaria conjuncta]|uniref:uncharacterized protein n=1 Tax=Alternaria conjuncta TaxID=181017 RepID=UPI00221FCD20|nr:uncharacterized protein J4E85_010503 [Alternaria conjuncta]KAI4914440.1 hypothetical protein J4E85_010503 [Alternaria conjuncta]
MEDNSDVTLRPDLGLRIMNFRLPSARKLSLVLLTIFALFAALAATSSFTTITAFATSAIKLATFALKFVPSSVKAPIQISNVTFNYVASVADDGKNMMDLSAWVHSIIISVTQKVSMVLKWLLVLALFLTLNSSICAIERKEAEKTKALGSVACIAPIHAPGNAADGVLIHAPVDATDRVLIHAPGNAPDKVLVHKKISTVVEQIETPWSTKVYKTVTETVTTTEKTERSVTRGAPDHRLMGY